MLPFCHQVRILEDGGGGDAANDLRCRCGLAAAVRSSILLRLLLPTPLLRDALLRCGGPTRNDAAARVLVAAVLAATRCVDDTIIIILVVATVDGVIIVYYTILLSCPSPSLYLLATVVYIMRLCFVVL